MPNEEINDGERVVLTRVWYERITNGADIRGVCREEDINEEEVRTSAAVLLIMYEVYPLSLTPNEVWERVNTEAPFHLMEDGAFRDYVRDIVQSKLN